jgi:nucleoid DNA-binding protein
MSKVKTIKKDEILTIIKNVYNLSSNKEAETRFCDLDSLIEVISSNLNAGEKVNIGKYLVIEKKHVDAKHKDARVGRNPKTGESIHIQAKDVPAHDIVTVKASKALNKEAE